MAQPSAARLTEMYTELRERAPSDFGRHRAALAQRANDEPPGPEKDRLVAELAIVNAVNATPGSGANK